MDKISKLKSQPTRKPQNTNGTFVMEEALKSALNAINFRSDIVHSSWERIELKIDIPGTVRLELTLEGSNGQRSDVNTAFYCEHDVVPMLAKMSVEDLDLAPHAKDGALSLVKAFGSLIVFTSGRRTVSGQCLAMAQNIVKTGDRKWIEKTYINSSARKKLQDWVDANPKSTTEADLAAGLEGVMKGFSDAELNMISYHFTGAAFDLTPVGGTDGDKIKQAINKLQNVRKFIDGENGVKVWHVDFNE